MKYMNKGRRVTMKDIAAATGYTVNTVSHALKDLPDISRQTRLEIQAAARDMGYVRNAVASALRSGRSHTLALIVGDLQNPKFAIMANDIEAAARAMGYSLVILCAHEDADLEAQAIRTAVARQVDGIILNPCQHSDACIAQLRASHIPFVLAERSFAEHEVDSVVCDEEEGGYLAAAHLLAQGHRRIVHLHGRLSVSSACLRREGFLRAASQYPDADVLCLPLKSGTENARTAISLSERGYTGIFVFSDITLWDLKAHLPSPLPPAAQALCYVGFDNIQRMLSFPDPLCSVDSASEMLCREAVALLDARIGGDDTPPRQVVFPVTLVCRNRCAAE